MINIFYLQGNRPLLFFGRTLRDRRGQGSWHAMILGVAKSRTQLSDWTTTTSSISSSRRTSDLPTHNLPMIIWGSKTELKLGQDRPEKISNSGFLRRNWRILLKVSSIFVQFYSKTGASGGESTLPLLSHFLSYVSFFPWRENKWVSSSELQQELVSDPFQTQGRCLPWKTSLCWAAQMNKAWEKGGGRMFYPKHMFLPLF